MFFLLLCVFIAAVMPVVCAGIAKGGAMGKPRREGGFDNAAPRDWLAKQTGYRARANAAQQNCFEALPFFVGAIAIALALNVPHETLALLAALWVALRTAYVAAYLANVANLRSVIWICALIVNAVILFLPLR
ncbi:MAG TPA: MAPEG family protein [Methylibium sp.]|uniref:MAPEG family protein n=1 Tax=Methylibium sp. TaxID=2067992 RepID=UPI002DB7EDAE|nr:MAPEG family protein [Methylibium sp.]HEU4459446.1 MAPEG family protein [Methylibium sp.]